MTDVLLGLILLAHVVLTSALLWRRRTALTPRVHRRCVVTLDDGSWFDGTLVEQDSRALVLRGAQTDGGAVDGEVLVLTADVAYMQFP